MIDSAKSELAELDALALGRPVATFWDAEYACRQFRYFSEAALPQGVSSLNTPNFVNFSLKQPYGVVAAIIPWNLPIMFLSKNVAPALAAGNTVILKTSEKAPLSSNRIAAMINEAGFPPGVFNIIHGHGMVSGEAISHHMTIRALSFTGSVHTGRAIQTAAARSNLKHLIMEMGGKSPALIFEDADLDKAVVETQHSIMWHSGQTCMANSRIYVQRSVAKSFIEKFTKLCAAWKAGDPSDPATNFGPQADKIQFDRVMRYVDDGKKTGEMISRPDGDGLFVPPTIFLGQPEDVPVMKHEIFGPVVCINHFDTEEEALKLANDSKYGLYAAVYTKDINRAMRVAKGLESGLVGVNCTSPTNATDMPFGGQKSSGSRERDSRLRSLENWLQEKSVFMKIGPTAV